MSGRCTGWVLKHGPKERAQRAVLIVIADAANSDGEHAHPGLQNIIEGSLYSRAHVLETLKSLVEDGWVEVEEEGGGRGRATVYRVCMERTERVQPPDRLADGNGPVQPEKGSNLGPETVQSRESAPLTATDNPTVVTTPAVPAGSSELLPETDPVAVVFARWVETTGRHPERTKLDSKRRRLIRRALREWDYPVADVLDAVAGWRNSPFHCGQNERGTVYNDLSLLLRDTEHLERFRDLERGEGPQGGAPVSRAAKGIADWLERTAG